MEILVMIKKIALAFCAMLLLAGCSSSSGKHGGANNSQIMEFEKEFNIAIPDDQAEKIATVGDAISYIEANAKN